MPRRVSVSVSTMPSRSDAAAPGWRALELGGEQAELVERAAVIGLRSRRGAAGA